MINMNLHHQKWIDIFWNGEFTGWTSTWRMWIDFCRRPGIIKPKLGVPPLIIDYGCGVWLKKHNQITSDIVHRWFGMFWLGMHELWICDMCVHTIDFETRYLMIHHDVDNPMMILDVYHRYQLPSGRQPHKCGNSQVYNSVGKIHHFNGHVP